MGRGVRGDAKWVSRLLRRCNFNENGFLIVCPVRTLYFFLLDYSGILAKVYLQYSMIWMECCVHRLELCSLLVFDEAVNLECWSFSDCDSRASLIVAEISTFAVSLF